MRDTQTQTAPMRRLQSSVRNTARRGVQLIDGVQMTGWSQDR
jgi:hypothetical protein